ncbi:DUF294 nucleotidyltransferase-like domain-containing protein [Aliidiomarina celeris]|uniref:DUF294 nucleotidyltransferase-like domain-containing protein n=1 Tax=Aliidiomarina celeris TaxID=2249428 RepID=UPI000DEB954A|nr:DUF294 nucleotidyltransferase-like domain-containing protein [Aliidiomarina celeris]
MDIEQIEIAEFLKRVAPFDALPGEEIEQLARQVDIAYFKAESSILMAEQPLSDLYIVRSGVVETFRRTGELYNRLSEGNFFAEQGLLRGRKAHFPAVSKSDTLLYLLPADVFDRLFETYEHFADYMEISEVERRQTRVVSASSGSDHELMTSPVASLLQRKLVMVSERLPVSQVAQRMSEHSVSSVLVVDSEQNPQALLGILTDRDIRNRLVAQRLPYSTPASDIMTTDLFTVAHDDYVFDAMLLMLRHNVHHLPVVNNGVPVGVIAISDLVQHEAKSSLYVVSSIFRQNSVAELAKLKADVRASFVRMVQQDANSHMIGSAMALIGRSFKQRLLELAEEQLGPPPIPYCFIALGSMAREEQLIVTDQDNAMILDDRYNEAEHGAYFLALAQFVCDGLDACGYPYCKGGIMATNNKWRQPRQVWHRYFQQWIKEPSAEGLLHSSIFFDVEGVWGEQHWVSALKREISGLAKTHIRFLASMVRNALLRTPPLGFFQDFIMETDGRQNKTLNIKRRGTAPAADLIRVHALASGCMQSNSFQRLKYLQKNAVLPKGKAEDLRDAYELIALTRIRHQALAIEQGEEPDNNVAPEQLSDFERRNLKRAFQVLSNAQKYLKFKYASIQ